MSSMPFRGKPSSSTSIERKEKKRNPVAPFITSRLQQEAARKLHFSPKKTMTLAQQLYEGDRNRRRRSTGLITYMRTDSPRISQEAMAEAQTGRSRSGSAPSIFPPRRTSIRPQKAAQEAHEAIQAHVGGARSGIGPCLSRTGSVQAVQIDLESVYRLADGAGDSGRDPRRILAGRTRRPVSVPFERHRGEVSRPYDCVHGRH